MHVPATGLVATDDATPATVRGGAGIVNTSPSSEPRLGRCCCSQPCCRKSTSRPTRCSWHCSPSSATSHPRAENDTVAAGAQKRQRDCRRGAATSSGAPRHAIHAGEAARQEDDQVKVRCERRQGHSRRRTPTTLADALIAGFGLPVRLRRASPTPSTDKAMLEARARGCHSACSRAPAPARMRRVAAGCKRKLILAVASSPRLLDQRCRRHRGPWTGAPPGRSS